MVTDVLSLRLEGTDVCAAGFEEIFSFADGLYGYGGFGDGAIADGISCHGWSCGVHDPLEASDPSAGSGLVPLEVTTCGLREISSALLNRRIYTWTALFVRGIDVTHQITDL